VIRADGHDNDNDDADYGESICQRNVILQLSMNRLETKNLRLWVGGTFLAMTRENGKGCRYR